MKQQNARGQWGGGFPQAGLRRVGQLERTGQASWLGADGTELEIAAYPVAQGRSVLRLRLGHTHRGLTMVCCPGLAKHRHWRSAKVKTAGRLRSMALSLILSETPHASH